MLDLPAATTAVLHGMMATLSEVLGGIDGRLGALERQVREARADTGSPRALAQTVEAAVARLAERIEALEAAVVAPRPTAGEGELLGLVRELAARPQAAVRDEELHWRVSDLAARTDAVQAALTELTGLAELAARPARDEELHQAVAALAARPARDEDLHAAVAELAARPLFDQALHAAVAELAARPVHDEALHAAVTALAARPVRDEELHAAVEVLAARPVRDEELHSAVAELAARPVRDDELHAAVDVLAHRPVHDDELRAAVADLAARHDALAAGLADLAQRPVRDEDLHAAVARLAELVARPPAAPGPDDPIRAGVTSLHERLNVLLDVVAQPPQPDDAVRLGLGQVETELAALRQTLTEALNEPEPEPEPAGPDPALLELTERLRQLEARTAAADEEVSGSLRLALSRLGEIASAIGDDPADEPDVDLYERLTAITAALVDHPAATLVDAIARMEEQLAAYTAQPGPGPAMAMVAAGLSERFEARTEALVDLLTGLSRELTGLSEAPAALDHVTARLDELQAVTQALPEAITAVTSDAAAALQATLSTRLDEAEQGIAAAAASIPELLSATQDALSARLDSLDAAPAQTVQRVEEFIGVQFAELARREDAVAAAISDLRMAGDRSAESAVLDRVRTVVEGQQGDVAAMREALRTMFEAVDRHGAVSGQVAELLLENRAALGREIDRLESAIGAQADDAAAQLRAAIDGLSQLQAGVGSTVADAVQAIRADVQALAATGQDPARLNAVADRISESVQRESELLTQRVAALSVAVESLRTMVESLPGRKASEVGRRLAADLGIRTAKPAKPGKLGPGSGS